MSQGVVPAAVTAAEISRNFGLWQDRASHSPVIVTHHGRPRIALLAIDAYEQLTAGAAVTPSNDDDAVCLSVLSENVMGAFASFDRDLRFTRVNAEASVHFDKPADSLLGRSFAELFPDRSDGPVISALRRVAEGAEKITFDVPSQVWPDRLLRMRIFAYPGGVASVFRNVTHEAKIGYAAQERDALQAARDLHGSVSVARLSLRATFDQSEPGLAQIAGIPAERLRGARLTDLLVPAERAAANVEIEAVLANGEGRRFRSRMLSNDGGEIDVRVALAPIREGFGITGAMMMLTTRDDTVVN